MLNFLKSLGIYILIGLLIVIIPSGAVNLFLSISSDEKKFRACFAIAFIIIYVMIYKLFKFSYTYNIKEAVGDVYYEHANYLLQYIIDDGDLPISLTENDIKFFYKYIDDYRKWLLHEFFRQQNNLKNFNYFLYRKCLHKRLFFLCTYYEFLVEEIFEKNNIENSHEMTDLGSYCYKLMYATSKLLVRKDNRIDEFRAECLSQLISAKKE